MHDVNWAVSRKRQTLEHRARIVQSIRAFFISGGFLEVETPQRIPANAPEPHIDAVASGEWWLQTSPELAMKRLLAAGYPAIFQLSRVWREHERGARHLPEFTLLEWYRSDSDYRSLMDDCEALLLTLVPGGVLSWQGGEIDLTSPWRRLSVRESFELYPSLTLEEALAANRFDQLITLEIEPRLGPGPGFLYDYPAGCAALARRKPGDEKFAERFELYVGGLELANAFSELCEPEEQRQRFERDTALRRESGKATGPLPEPFLDDLQHLDSAAGIALGVDRLVMLLCDAAAIDDVVAFPPELL